MERDYKMINEEIAVTGFFSEYLPPCFNITKDFFKCVPKDNCDLIKPMSFTMSRFNNNESRRIISIPEFGSYLVLSNYIKEKSIVQEIVEFCESQNRSFSPILSHDNTIVKHEQVYNPKIEDEEDSVSEYIKNIIKKMKMSAGAKKILKLDISNCYSSFYMHIIPTILLGVEKTEIEYKKYCNNKEDPTISRIYIKYQKLDKLTRQQNMNQTNGLLVGKLYSKILSEGILTRIDIELEEQGISYARYVDDYEVFLYEDNEKQVISTFEKILSKYGFSINTEKTEIVSFPYYVSNNLEKLFLNRYKEYFTEDELMSLFNTFYELEEHGTKGSIRYLLKKLSINEVTVSDPELYKAYLLTILRNNERSLTKACSIIIDSKENIKLNNSDIIKIEDLISECINNEFDLETIWLIYLLIETENIIHNEIIDRIIDSKNELVQIMLLRKGLLTDMQINSMINNCRSWLALFELYSMDYIDEEFFKEKLQLKNNLEMYNYLRKKEYHFVYQ